MKKLIIAAFVSLGLATSASAQTEYAFKEYNQKYEIPASKFYLGVGTGLNNYLGLIGPSAEYRLSDKITVFGGAGLGSWGWKTSAGLKYYGNFPEGWSFNLGISHATGLDNIEIELPSECVQFASDKTKVPFDLKGANTLNLSAMKYWPLGTFSKTRFNIELGYAIPLGENQYEVKSTDVLTSKGKYFMNILQPGGLILGLGFSFGL